MQLHRVSILISFLLFQTPFYPLLAQITPVIEAIDKTRGTVNEIVTIKGKGFGSDNNKVRVFFGAALAALADSTKEITDTEIKVLVPAGATSSSISVTNLSTHLTAYSGELFTLSYDGFDFDRNSLETERKFTTSGTNLYNLCFCDFNLDGLNDIATTDTDSKLVTILQNNTPDINSPASFISREIDLDAKTRWVRCGDINGDGFPDLVFSASNMNINKERVYVFRNTSTRGGNITFEDKSIKTPVSSYIVEGTLAARMEIKDLDGDGLPEIAAVDLSTIGGVSVFRNISVPGEAISFTPTPVKPFSTFGIPTVELNSVDLEDLNGDGLPELLAGKEGKNGTYVFTNNSTPGNIQFSSYIMLDAPGRTSNMKVGDVDNDHKPDVVITNDAYVAVFKNITETDGAITFANHMRFDQTSLIREGLDMADMDGNGKLDIIIGSTTNRIVVLMNNSTEETLDFNTKKVLLVEENNMSVRAGDLNGDGKPDLAYTARDTDAIAVLLNRNCVKPVLEPQSGLSVCDVLPYQLTVTKAIGVTYTWESSADGINFTSVADAVDSTISYTTENEAFYRVKMSSSHNGFICTINSNIVKVARPDGFVPDKPVILEKDPVTPYCFGENIFLKAASVNAQYHWTGPNNFKSNEQNPTILNATAAHEGTYILYVQASAENGGCVSDTATTYIKVSEPEAITIHSNELPVFFEGGQATLSVEDFAGNVYSWKKNGQLINNAINAELTVTTAGDYVATIKNTLGCTRESTPFTIAFAHANIPEEECLGEPVEFTVTPTSLAGQNMRYRWLFGDGESMEGATVSYQYKTAGNYTVAVEILATDGRVTDRYEEDIIILDLPDLSITTTNNAYICPEESVELAVNDGFSSYTWSTGESSKGITVNEAGIYTITVVAMSGCTVSKTIEVKDANSPENTITARAERISLGDTLQIIAPKIDSATYLWSPSNTLSDSTLRNPIARPLLTTTYTCLITNAQGCQSTAEFTVTVDRSLDVSAQKAFTPNDDGKHDTWFIEKMDLYPDCRMTIFNRQGIKIYEAENYSNENGWDGTIRGQPTPPGVYFYLIDCGKEAGRQTGSVTIVR